MKYERYKIDKGIIVNSRVDHDLYQVFGQKETDLNWERIGEPVTNIKDAMTIAIQDRKVNAKNNKWCPVYDSNGYQYMEMIF